MFKPVRIHPLLLIIGVAVLFALILGVAWLNIRPAPTPAVYVPTYQSDYHTGPTVVVVDAKRKSYPVIVQAKKRAVNVPPRVYAGQPSRASVRTTRTVTVTTTRRR